MDKIKLFAKKHPIWSVIIGMLLLGMILAPFDNTDAQDKKPNASVKSSAKKTSENSVSEQKKDSAPTKSQEELDADAIKPILSQIDAGDVYTVEHDAGLDGLVVDKGELGYRVTTDRVDNLCCYVLDGQVILASYASKDYYKDGKVLAKLSDYTLSDSEMSAYKTVTEEIINTVLKAPSSADYPSITEWGFQKKKGKVIVESYVDAQNSFGAMLRSEFRVKYKNETPYSVVFDGEEYLK